MKILFVVYAVLSLSLSILTFAGIFVLAEDLDNLNKRTRKFESDIKIFKMYMKIPESLRLKEES